jgi:hypothetical protein
MWPSLGVVVACVVGVSVPLVTREPVGAMLIIVGAQRTFQNIVAVVLLRVLINRQFIDIFASKTGRRDLPRIEQLFLHSTSFIQAETKKTAMGRSQSNGASKIVGVRKSGFSFNDV